MCCASVDWCVILWGEGIGFVLACVCTSDSLVYIVRVDGGDVNSDEI